MEEEELPDEPTAIVAPAVTIGAVAGAATGIVFVKEDLVATATEGVAGGADEGAEGALACAY